MVRRSQEEWKILIQQQKSSGQTTREFCKEHNISERYFSSVKYKFKKSAKATLGKEKFQPVGALVPTQHITLQRGDLKISLPLSVDSAWLAKLAQQLAQ